MFEDLFGEPEREPGAPTIPTTPLAPEAPKIGMFEGLFEEPGIKPPTEEGFQVSLTPKLELQRVDTEEIFPKEELTPEMRTIRKDLLTQLLEAQRKGAEAIPTGWLGVAKAGVKELAEKAKAEFELTKESLKYLPEELLSVEGLKKNIPKGAESFASGLVKAPVETFLGLGNLFVTIAPEQIVSKETKRQVQRNWSEIQRNIAPELGELPGYLVGKYAEIATLTGITRHALTSIPTVQTFATKFPKIFDMATMGLTGAARGQLDVMPEADWKQRLKEGVIDFSSWAAWSWTGGIPKKEWWKYMSAYFTIGYTSSKLEGRTQEESLIAGFSSAVVGSLFKLAEVPKKTRDIMKEKAQTVLNKYNIKTHKDYIKAMRIYHPDRPTGDPKIASQITSAWDVIGKSPKQLERGLMQEFQDLWKGITTRPVPRERVMEPYIPPVAPRPPVAPVAPKPAPVITMPPAKVVAPPVKEPLLQRALTFISRDGAKQMQKISPEAAEIWRGTDISKAKSVDEASAILDRAIPASLKKDPDVRMTLRNFPESAKRLMGIEAKPAPRIAPERPKAPPERIEPKVEEIVPTLRKRILTVPEQIVYRGVEGERQIIRRKLGEEIKKFGEGLYVETERAAAEKWAVPEGKVIESEIKLKESEILRINNSKEYDAFIKESLEYAKKIGKPGLDPMKAMPLYAKSEGYKAIWGNPKYDPLAGMNIIDKAVIVKPKVPPKVKVPEWADDVDRIIAGEIAMRPPVELKTDWRETLGKGQYMRIFRGGEFAPAPDEVADRLGMTEGELLEKVAGKLRAPKPKVTPETLEKLYVKGIDRARRRPKVPVVGLSVKNIESTTRKNAETILTVLSIKDHVKKFITDAKEIIKPFQFYPDLSLKLKNDIRVDLIGGYSKARDKVYNRISVALWGGLTEEEVAQSVELIYARDQLSRAKLGKGDPTVTVKQAQQLVDKLEKAISPEAKGAASRYRTIQEEYRQGLVKRGKLDPERKIDDYVRHFVSDYTPNWIFRKGIPTRLRRPFRGYLKKAKGTTKEIRQDAEAILGQFLMVDYDNVVEDFIAKQVKNYDISKTLTRQQKIELFGETKAGLVRHYGKPGVIYTIKGKRYRVWTPDIPFSRQLFPTEEGLMAIGRYKRTYLIPENVYNSFREFSERGNRWLAYANRLTGYWKTMAITSRFPSFNLNNMIGDSWMALLQAPQPLELMGELDTSLNYLVKKPDQYTPYLKRLDKFIKSQSIVEATFIRREVYRIKGAPSPVAYILNKARSVSQFRESILRVAYASYLLKGQEAGKARDLIKYHNWVATHGLSENEALGRIARVVLVDYGWTSKTFNRIIRGLGFPFATWYVKASSTVWRFTKRHLVRALLFFLSLPILSTLFNNRSKKIRELEQRLSDNTRDRVHFVLGETPEGKVRVWYLQLPQDVLIGTKFYSIAVNQVNMVINGEKTIKEAAQDTLERWGIREIRGIAYMMAPAIRYIRGLIDRKDPYDKTDVYSISRERLPLTRRIWEEALYFQRCFIPWLAEYTREEVVKYPKEEDFKDRAFEAVRENLGVYDVTKKDQIEHEGRIYDWDDYRKVQDIANKEIVIIAKVENDWVESGLVPMEFVKTEEFKKSMRDIKNVWAKHNPKAKDLTEIEVALALGERLESALGGDSTSAKRWLSWKLERAKTPEEQKKWREIYEDFRKEKFIESLKRLPESAREIYFK